MTRQVALSPSQETAPLPKVQTSEMRNAVCRSSITPGTRPDLFIPRAQAVVFSPTNLVARNQDLGLFPWRVRNHFIRLDIPWRLHVLRRIESNPLVSDAVAEEGSKRLQLNLPRHSTYDPGPTVIL